VVRKQCSSIIVGTMSAAEDGTMSPTCGFSAVGHNLITFLYLVVCCHVGVIRAEVAELVLAFQYIRIMLDIKLSL
jgi:hypothetical protein